MKLEFCQLWFNHPRNWPQGPTHGPCRNRRGQPAYENQCAIRLSIALERSGVRVGAGGSSQCAHGHMRSAEQMARWLASVEMVPYVGQPLRHPQPFEYGNRTGIMAWIGYISSENRTLTNHIDLWNRYGIPQDSEYDGQPGPRTVAQMQNRTMRPYTDSFRTAREVIFWEIPWCRAHA